MRLRRMKMTVKQLLNYLNTIENKEQDVYMTSYDLQTQTDIENAVEIKSSSSCNMFASGVCLLGDL